MKKEFKNAIVECATKLIDAVNADNFEEVAKCVQFLNFAGETCSRIIAFDNYLKTKNDEQTKEK